MQSLLLAGAVAAAELPTCEPFVLHGGHYEIVGLDHDADGNSLGDERIAWQNLFDDNDVFVGKVRLMHVVVEPIEGSDDGSITMGTTAFSLKGGTIFGQVIMDYSSDFGDDELPTSNMTIAIVGGTGKFVRSEGQIVVTFEPQTLTPTHIEFQVFCD